MQLTLKRFLIVACVLLHLTADGQTRITASTQAEEVLVGVPFDVKYKVEGLELSQVEVPRFRDFEVLRGPDYGKKLTIINGHRSESRSITYTLAGKRPGTFTIPPAVAETSAGSEVRSNGLTVKVLPRSKSGKKKMPDVFVETAISDTAAYPGQSVVLSYYLNTAVNLDDYRIESEDEYAAFDTQPEDVQEEGKFRVIDGRQYMRKLIRRVVLRPRAAGRVKIKPMVLSVRRVEQASMADDIISRFFRDDPFGRDMFRRAAALEVRSKPIEINVRELPRPIPRTFSGVVGPVTLEVRMQDTAITTNDVVSFIATLSGNGASVDIKPPVLDLPDGLTAFPPKLIQDTLIADENGRMRFQNKYEYLIQPNRADRYHLFAVTSYFDPKSRSYKEVRSDVQKLVVRAAQAATVASRADEEDDNLSWSKAVSLKKWLWLVGIMLIVVPLLFWWRGRVRKMTPPVEYAPVSKPSATEKRTRPGVAVQEKPAARTGKDKFAPAHAGARSYFEEPSGLTGKAYMRQVRREAERFFRDKLDISPGQVQKEMLMKRLAEENHPADLIRDLGQWWDAVEAHLYGNMPLPKSESEMLDEIRRLAKRLDA